MKHNKNIWLLVGDLGYGGADKIRKDFPDRFVNCGASEFSMIGIAAGLALEGKIPFTYTITPFYLRAFEIIRTYIDHEKIPIKMIASGRDKDYAHDGFSHDATDIPLYFDALTHVQSGYPAHEDDLKDIVKTMLQHAKPYFLNLRR